MDGRKLLKTFIIVFIITAIVAVFFLYAFTYHKATIRHWMQKNPSQGQNKYGDTFYAQKFPSAIIIGVKKGGTKALISMLDAHPNIKAAKGEVHFFDRITNYGEGLGWYLRRMPLTTSGELGIEKSPSYFVVPEVPRRIARFSKDVKLILTVRDPVARLISDYTQLNGKKAHRGRKRKSFEKYVFKPDGSIFKVSMIQVSMYDTHFKRWLDFFSRSQILVVDGDRLIKDPFEEISRVEKFLNVPQYFTKGMFHYNVTKGFYCWKTARANMKCLGSHKGRKHPNVSNDTIVKLKDFYKPHMASFCSLANIDFNLCK